MAKKKTEKKKNKKTKKAKELTPEEKGDRIRAGLTKKRKVQDFNNPKKTADAETE